MLSSLSSRIAAALSLPMLVLIMIAVYYLGETRREIAMAAGQLNLVETGQAASALAHELQKERGRTVGLITSKYDHGRANAVAEQRSLTDEALKTYALQIVEDAAWQGIDQALVERIDAQIRAIAGQRDQVDQRDMTVPANVGFYTSLIEDLLEIMRAAVAASPSQAIANAALPV